MNVYGYIRPDVEGETGNKQIPAPRNAGVAVDGYISDLSVLQKGDLLYINAMAALGESYEEILRSWQEITERQGADIVVLNIPTLDTRIGKDAGRSPISDAVIQMLMFVIEKEHLQRQQRQAQGIADAKARGVRFGRPKKAAPLDFEKIVSAWEKKQMSIEAAISLCDMSESTFYRRVREHRKKKHQADSRECVKKD